VQGLCLSVSQAGPVGWHERDDRKELSPSGASQLSVCLVGQGMARRSRTEPTTWQISGNEIWLSVCRQAHSPIVILAECRVRIIG
jgi:hypothetical protein